MVEDAINTLVDVLDSYPVLSEISIIDRDHFYLHWEGENGQDHKKEFSDTVQMLGWLEIESPEKIRANQLINLL